MNRFSRIERIRDKFRGIFKNDKGILMVRAPGRVNLIGEHTDYNEGFVFPIALKRDMIIMGQPRKDREVIFYSLDFAEKTQFSLDRIKFNSQNKWVNYLQGVAYLLEKEGYKLKGMNAVLQSDIPQEASLSSSAALEIASALIFQLLNNFAMEPLKMIKLCQRAENEFVGVNCGIMDQFISCLGKENKGLFLDCRHLKYEFIPLKQKIIICNTKIKRKLTNSAYNIRRKECEEGVKIFQQYLPQVSALRDVSWENYEEYKDKLPDEVRKRCVHIIKENQRVRESVKALKENNLIKFGELMNESQRSLKDLYEVSCPELDIMVEVAQSVKGVLGARMTGAGFGGCTVNLVKEEAIKEFKKVVKDRYFKRTGLFPEIYVSLPAKGAGRIKL